MEKIKNGYLLSLNTSTIRGQNLTPEQEIDIAAQAGFDGVELWLRDIYRFLEQGGTLSTIKAKLEETGLSFYCGISFSEWIVNDPVLRSRGLENARRDMEILSELGCKYLAAPPEGARRGVSVETAAIADRFRNLQQLGKNFGVTPLLEFWGFSQNLKTIDQAVAVGHCLDKDSFALLADVYHLHRGQSDLSTLKEMNQSWLPILHINDYPEAEPSSLTDADRVFPGDGCAPLKEMIDIIGGFRERPVLSLELFNRNYWQQNPLDVAKQGLCKMKSVLESSLR